MACCTKFFFFILLIEFHRNVYLVQLCHHGISSESGIELHGFVYKSIAGVDLGTCIVNCIQDEICQSINFDTAQFYCQFNNETKRRKPNNVRPKEHSVYMENIARAKIGSNAIFPGHYSCKEINDLGDSRGDGEYWIDPGNTGQPFIVYCDMTTDSGGWTLIRRALLPTATPDLFVARTDYKLLANYTDYRQVINAPALQKLREDMGFHQIRFRCRKKSINRTIHIMTTNNTAGHKVLDHFLVKPTWPTACNSFKILPDDTSILAQNCLKWGYDDVKEINRWGTANARGDRRIYFRPMVWVDKHVFSSTIPSQYYCDDHKSGIYGELKVGDIWEVFVS